MARGVKGTGPRSRAAPKAAAKVARPRIAPAPEAPPPAQLAPPPIVAIEVDDRRPVGSVDVDSLSGDALRRYARRAGVLPRDCENLTEDRLRQNTKIVIANHFELLTE